MNFSRSGIRLDRNNYVSTFLKTVTLCKHNQSILIQFHLFSSSAREEKYKYDVFEPLQLSSLHGECSFKRPAWFSVISIML